MSAAAACQIAAAPLIRLSCVAYTMEVRCWRILAVILIERGEQIRVVTAYDLDAGQKRDYLARRVRGE